ncbi:glycoside hydrolase family 88/105 protein [Mucilaginibacter arboris]|uniref:Glycoside hydrolase family 88 protein n=1 Tax=Mucilaginibacter arboris TaxID=2682090 RepID=A0A7K1SU17_9SPHI|nr:glycoside hydrolase family 88 protein [Mucilaginibacter arboris]MVN20816.1 glycoside hydrolase family 88 protein [Mucilaginibacter arboris]
MNKLNLLKKITFAGIAFLAVGISTQAQPLPSKKEVLKVMQLTNNYFMQKWPDPGKEITTNRTRPSNIWTRGVYYEGLMALYQIDKDKKYYDYAVDWGQKHQWNLRNGITTRNADDQTCGQTYIDLYQMDKQPERIKNIKASIDLMMKTDKIDDWTWVDALQMAMPVYAKLGVQYKDNAYFERMYQMYNHTKTAEGGGLYNTKEHLWWRDKDFVPPYKEPNGENCYWSRGNGWVFAALVRVMDLIPKNEAHRAEYLQTFKEMAAALVPLQRTDGFWNVSLKDPTHFGGKETTGTALFVYGMAWGINNGVLDAKIYRPVLLKAWNAMVKDAVHPDGMLGFVQGTGKEPKDSQPVSYTNIPDFEDYGLGCFLLAGSEVYKLKK